MRIFSFILAFALLFSCKPECKQDCSAEIATIHAQDSVKIDSLITENGKLMTMNVQLSDSISGFVISKTNIDTLKTNLFLANYKVEKVKFYLNICNRDQTQTKFLRGWIIRAVQ